MLKDKAKIDFEGWYEKQNYQSFGRISLPAFYGCPKTMQQGVLRAFWESKGIHFEHQRSEISEGDIQYAFMILDGDNNLLAPVITAPDYSTAFTHAIDKACEVYGGEG